MKMLALKGHTVKQTDDEVDFLITQMTTDIADGGRKVVVLGDDIDLLVILISNTTATIFMKPALYLIQAIQSESPGLSRSILFAHSVSGCDKTSALCQKSKVKCLKIFKKDELQDFVEVFNAPDSSKEIFNAACKCLMVLYGGNSKRKLIKELRLIVF